MILEIVTLLGKTTRNEANAWVGGSQRGQEGHREGLGGMTQTNSQAVSYTHLTLPTSLRV